MNKKNNIDIEFILVEPSHPGNIGACARAIKNMGFKKLALVNPRKKITEEAFHRAKSAKDILDSLIKDKPLKPGSYRGRANTSPEKKQTINGENHA